MEEPARVKDIVAVSIEIIRLRRALVDPQGIVVVVVNVSFLPCITLLVVEPNFDQSLSGHFLQMPIPFLGFFFFFLI